MPFKDIESNYNVLEDLAHVINMMEYNQISGFTVEKGQGFKDYIIKLHDNDIEEEE